jgi:hypothetical protein
MVTDRVTAMSVNIIIIYFSCGPLDAATIDICYRMLKDEFYFDLLYQEKRRRKQEKKVEIRKPALCSLIRNLMRQTF